MSVGVSDHGGGILMDALTNRKSHVVRCRDLYFFLLTICIRNHSYHKSTLNAFLALQVVGIKVPDTCLGSDPKAKWTEIQIFYLYSLDLSISNVRYIIRCRHELI